MVVPKLFLSDAIATSACLAELFLCTGTRGVEVVVCILLQDLCPRTPGWENHYSRQHPTSLFVFSFLLFQVLYQPMVK